MFNRLKNLVSGVGFLMKYGDIIRDVTTAWSTYPGLDDADMLRLWVRPLLVDASELTRLTKTPVDDIVVFAAIRIVDDNRSWIAVHAMALLLRDGMNAEGTLVPGAPGDFFETTRLIALDTMPECSSAALAALGMILLLLQQRSNRK